MDFQLYHLFYQGKSLLSNERLKLLTLPILLLYLYIEFSFLLVDY